jgi:hypothetical protein
MRAMSQLELVHVAVGGPQVDRSGAPCEMLSGISARGKNQIEISSSVKSVAITPPPKQARLVVSDFLLAPRYEEKELDLPPALNSWPYEALPAR